MTRRAWIVGLLILTQFAASGCALFRRDDCCGERRGLFGSLFNRRSKGMPMEYGAPCNTCSTGDLHGATMMGGPMLAAPGGPPDERLGPPAANRPWDGQGPPPAKTK